RPSALRNRTGRWTVVAARVARRSIRDDRTGPILQHISDAGQGADAERAGTGVLSLQAWNNRGDGGVGRATVDRRSEKYFPRSHRGRTRQMMNDQFLPTNNVVLDQNVLVINTGDKLSLFETGMSSVKRNEH